jgi:hypothetical protein
MNMKSTRFTEEQIVGILRSKKPHSKTAEAKFGDLDAAEFRKASLANVGGKASAV